MGKPEYIERVQLLPWMGYVHVAYPTIIFGSDCAAAHGMSSHVCDGVTRSPHKQSDLNITIISDPGYSILEILYFVRKQCIVFEVDMRFH